MKFIKVCSLCILLILSTGLMSTKNDNIPLSQEDLKYIFPDDNFRRVVTSYFPNEDITMSKLNDLDGEFYASGENIKDLKGISTLKNIDTFIFWNNNINYIPTEIKSLNKVKYINLANNYLTENDVLEALESRGVKVNDDLNFIEDENYQYELRTKTTNLYLSKNEKADLRSLLYKTIDNYSKEWEVTNKINSNTTLYIESNSPTNMSVNSEEGICKAGEKSGTYYVVVSLSKNKLPKPSVIIKTVVK